MFSDSKKLKLGSVPSVFNFPVHLQHNSSKRTVSADHVSTRDDVDTGNKSPSKEDLLEKIDHQNKKIKLLQQKVRRQRKKLIRYQILLLY